MPMRVSSGNMAAARGDAAPCESPPPQRAAPREPPKQRADPVVYWERQGADCLCAVHCLNALLQAPHFSAELLAELARELDHEEMQLLGSEFDANGESSNVDSRGNFSSQVVIRALQQCDFSVFDSNHAALRAEIAERPELETGYVCNIHRHWLTLRKLQWHKTHAWFNLNSRGVGGPTYLDTEGLSQMLTSIKSKGHTVLVIRGAFDPPVPERFAAAGLLESHQMFLNRDRMKEMQLEAVAAQRERIRAKGSLIDAVAHGLLDLAKKGHWDLLFDELEKAEQSRAEPEGPRYVDRIPPPRRYGLLHFAALQGRARELERLIWDFSAHSDLRTVPDGLSAADVARDAGHTVVFDALAGGGVVGDAGPLPDKRRMILI